MQIKDKLFIGLASLIIGYSPIHAQSKDMPNKHIEKVSQQQIGSKGSEDSLFNTRIHEYIEGSSLFSEEAKNVLRNNVYLKMKSDGDDSLPSGAYFNNDTSKACSKDVILINEEKIVKCGADKKKALDCVMERIYSARSKGETVHSRTLDSLRFALNEWETFYSSSLSQVLTHECLHDILAEMLNKNSEDSTRIINYAVSRNDIYRKATEARNMTQQSLSLDKCCPAVNNSDNLESFIFTNVASDYDEDHFVRTEVIPYLGVMILDDPSLTPTELVHVFKKIFPGLFDQEEPVKITVKHDE